MLNALSTLIGHRVNNVAKHLIQSGKPTHQPNDLLTWDSREKHHDSRTIVHQRLMNLITVYLHLKRGLQHTFESLVDTPVAWKPRNCTRDISNEQQEYKVWELRCHVVLARQQIRIDRFKGIGCCLARGARRRFRHGDALPGLLFFSEAVLNHQADLSAARRTASAVHCLPRGVTTFIRLSSPAIFLNDIWLFCITEIVDFTFKAFLSAITPGQHGPEPA
jgi:hypothetical protein